MLWSKWLTVATGWNICLKKFKLKKHKTMKLQLHFLKINCSINKLAKI